ncbi:DUF11 domain-containing protein [Merismopedia glauca]|uniref:DUF11 domain-containing protein n=1 Tax=Merismopedia glauca CCAP 1448/3 TaxID=1296344 RepID=A0A2T1C5S3_9CYAN|nr:DUF11 domain-containing protein [Merismopedia glauca]PSB03487.1 hypothetical protein C7B64_08350 [Merismopedia glauca CCAP 1448/3]
MSKYPPRSRPHQKYLQLLVSTVFLGIQFPVIGQQAIAQTPTTTNTTNKCQAIIPLSNQAEYSYRVQSYKSGSQPEVVDPSQVLQTLKLLSGTVKSSISLEDRNQITVAGIENSEGNLALGSVAGGLNDSLTKFNFLSDESKLASLAAIRAWSKISANPTLIEIGNTAQEEIITAVPDKKSTLEALGTSPETRAKNLVLLPLKYTLIASGVTPDQAEEATQSLQGTETLSQTFTRIAEKLPQKSQAIARVQKIWDTDLDNIRQGVPVSVTKGDTLAFSFQVTNPAKSAIPYEIPSVETLQSSGITGPGTVKEIKYQFLNSDGTKTAEISATPNQEIVIPPEGTVILKVSVQVGEIPQDGGSVRVKISECDGTFAEQTIISSPPISRLTDPSGRITSCTGGELADYNGFNVGLYEPDPNDTTGGIRGATPLTGTEFPDLPGNKKPKGLVPNIENSNPFFLTNSDRGRYSFLLDKSKGQLNEGRSYILLVNPPANSDYGQRRVRLTIGKTNTRTDGSEIVNYTATSLDGLPISLLINNGQNIPPGNSQTEGQFGSFVEQGEILVEDADAQGLSIAAISLSTSVCEDTDIQITKTGDRAAAEPGDTVIYRLSIKNLTESEIKNLQVTDILPLGFRLVSNSAKAETALVNVPITANTNGSQVTFEIPNTRLQAKGVLNIAYAATLTPDAIRGNGENIASVNGQRADNLLPVKDGPAIYKLRIRPGILTDTGTIVGRVFVDKNFDGEQQPGEPGVPNAVVLMDDGNRIVTDPNGLFSVANVQPGYRTGVLDFTSLQGYTLAPNLYFSERNSQSRLVHLEPGGLVRMNFAVTPTAKEEK